MLGNLIANYPEGGVGGLFGETISDCSCTTSFYGLNFVPPFVKYIQGVHKRMVRFQKLTRNRFLVNF